jgi:integrase/recombinase XerD
VGEVVALTLDDIDWRNGTIRIAAGKSLQDRLLPLPNRIGRVLVDYLRHGRPKTACRSLFVRLTTPVGTPVSSRAIRYHVDRALAKVEGCAGWTGTHLLRHTAATRMYRRGASLKHVADILGHRSLETTALYAKVNLEQLAAVALPWPKGGRS